MRSKLQKISDPVMEPFIIYRDEYSFTVKEVLQSNSSHHFSSKTKAKSYEKIVGYYPNIEMALTEISRRKVDSQPDYDILLNYVNDIKLSIKQLKEYYDKVRSTI
jgi:hypothetical protein